MKNLIRKIVYSLLRLLPVNNNRVLFFSYYGGNYGGSPKYLSEYLKENAGELELVWAFTNPDKHSNLQSVRTVRYGSLWYCYYLSTSGVIITNYRMTQEFKKRKDQRYIQTWHSSLRLKMIEKDAEDTLPANYVEMAKKDSTQIDVLLVGNRKSEEIFRRAFWYSGEYLRCGTPQCDLFFHPVACEKKVRNHFKVDRDKKILLYAPTFRKNHDLKAYNIDFRRLICVLEKRFGGEWVVLLRLHPHLIHKVSEMKLADGIIDATAYDDTQELLATANMVITDYSALMFDYLITKKPCFIYASDYENYVAQDRQLYFSMAELPFPVAQNNDELSEIIAEFDEQKYADKCAVFLKQAIGSWETGTSCQQVLEYIRGEINGK